MTKRTAKDLHVGLKVGRWTLLARTKGTKHSKARWSCLCDCGNSGLVSCDSLSASLSRSCGCLRIDTVIARTERLKAGDTVGRWTLISKKRGKKTGGQWFCKCRCGVEKFVDAGSLNSRASRSCGCLKAEVTKSIITTHGESCSPEFSSWINMLQRCSNPQNPQYHDYGGRGISVCDAFKSFEAFVACVGKKTSADLTIDRIDVNGNYEPGNVRWADRKTQQRNKRNSKRIVFCGESKTAAEWSELVGISFKVISQRLGYGWSVEDSLLTPLRITSRTKSLQIGE